MSVSLAVKGLAVLTVIPVVILAIWADYFGRAVERLAKESPDYDRPSELFKARLAGSIAMFFQLGIFLSTGAAREEAPLLYYLIFLMAILAQALIQSGAEKKLRQSRKEELTPQPVQDLEVAARAFLWATVAGVIYLVGFLVPVLAATLLTRFFQASSTASAIFVLAAAVSGMAGGLAINFALGAFYLRKMLPAKEISNEKLKSSIESCFACAGVAAPSLWIVGSGKIREATALVAGFASGRGLLRPGFFLSQAMMEALTDAELRAIVLHEAAHMKLRHLRKRLLYAAGLAVGTTAAATFIVFLAAALFPQGELKNLIGFGAAATAFIATFRLLGRQSQAHETEADFHAVGTLGAGFAELASALRKIDAVNQSDPLRRNPLSVVGGPTHPATELRIAALEARFGGESFEQILAGERRDRAA